MKNIKNILFYILVVGGFTLFIYLVVRKGQALQSPGLSDHVAASQLSGLEQAVKTLHNNVTHALAVLILQIITIIVAARSFGFLLRKIGQQSVIGEIIAGILLGPSFAGFYFPGFSAFLFPASSLPNLTFFSQVGLIFFMFIIGMELDLKVLKKKAHEAFIVSHASIIIPFALGICLAYTMYRTYAPQDVNFLSFSLFIGISLSVTAFPVLARIVQERQLTKTRVGAIAITCAAIDDITAWCILAAVIAIVKAGSVISAVYTVVMAIGFVVLMLTVVRPFLKRLGDIYSQHDTVSKPVVAVFFVTLLSSAFISEIIGIHALFGAFLAGVIMPQNLHFRNLFIEKVEDVSIVLLLPLFFVLTGLRTQIGLLNDAGLWKMCGIITLVATMGKFLGSSLAAKFTGQNWRSSLMIGALMNTRGLMELIVLNIGFDLGVLSPQVFAMMVIMALATTFMTAPALDLINYVLPARKTIADEETQVYKNFRILFSFSNVERGKSMVRLAAGFSGKVSENTLVTALHLVSSNETKQFNLKDKERESFKPVIREANKFNLVIRTLFKSTLDVKREIAETANDGDYDLLIISMGESIYQGSLLGRLLGITSKIINPEKLYQSIRNRENPLAEADFDENTNFLLRSFRGTLGVFTDKGLKKADDVIILIFSQEDAFLVEFGKKLIHNNSSRVVVLDYNQVVRSTSVMRENIRSIEQIAPNHIALFGRDKLSAQVLSEMDLMLISVDSWRRMLVMDVPWLSNVPSLLIMKDLNK